MNGGPAGEGRRQSLIKLASAMTFLAIVGVAVLIVITQSRTSGGDTKLEGVGQVRSLLDGLPQHGMVLGEPKAKATLVEFGDLQCPVCRDYSEKVLPQVIEGVVARRGAKLEFRNYTIIGPESVAAGAAALAAGEQGRAWSFVELFYRNQGEERSGYVTDAFLTAVAKDAGVPDIARWNRDRRSKRLLDEVAETTHEAANLGFTGTPSFALESSGAVGVEPLGQLPSAGAMESAIASAH
jgi:protein-disulfide isomerase